MRKISCTHALGIALLLVAGSSVGMIAAGAQSTQPAAQSANAPATPPTTTDVNKPKAANKKLTPPPGKMRGLTNEMRWAAAIRTADRKAHAHAKVNGRATQSEVHQ